jgi:hypothetical protein
MANLSVPLYKQKQNKPTKEVNAIVFEKQPLLGYSAKKLISGLIMVAITLGVFNYFGIYWGEKAEKSIIPALESVFDKENATFFSSIIISAGYITLFTLFVKGVYRVMTCNQFLEAFEGKNTSGWEYSAAQQAAFSNKSTSAIDNAYSYRNSLMQNMAPDNAVKFYMETSKLNNSPMSDSTKGYINSKLSMMSPDKTIDFLRGK